MLSLTALLPLLAKVWIVAMTMAATAQLYRCRRLVAGTTLISPWFWTHAAILGIGCTLLIVETAGSDEGVHATSWKEAILFAAASISFCPLMALLGAKRPQDRGWHFVVISLWAILVLPVAESLVLRHGQMPDVAGARSWFMLILISIGIVNALCTRYWLPAFMFGCGQLLMLADSLPLIREFLDASLGIAGYSCCAIAVILASLLAERSYGQLENNQLGAFDTVWRDFRDAFGLLWALRVAEQINIAARSNEWSLRLHWHGFVDAHGSRLDLNSLPEVTRDALKQVLHNLLRRFVTSDWIAARIGDTVE